MRRLLGLESESLSPRHKVVSQWLKLLPVVNWEGVMVEKNALEGVPYQAFES